MNDIAAAVPVREVQSHRIGTEKIDPVRAGELLATTVNRRRQDAHVQKLARDMKAGCWRGNSVIQIAATPEGEVLIDGQHRMAAVIVADATFEFVVMHGLSLDDQQVIDTGRSRSLGDTLVLRKELNASVLASAIAWYWRRQRRQYYHASYSPTIAEGLALLEANPGLRHGIRPTRGAARGLKVPVGLACCLYYEMQAIDADSADDFWYKLDTALELDDTSPIYHLRSRLEANAVSRTTNLDQTMIHALVIKTWNLYLKGDPVLQLRWARGGAKPEPFPELGKPEQ